MTPCYAVHLAAEAIIKKLTAEEIDALAYALSFPDVIRKLRKKVGKRAAELAQSHPRPLRWMD